LLNRDFLHGAVLATALSLVLHGLLPAAPAPADRRKVSTPVIAIGGLNLAGGVPTTAPKPVQQKGRGKEKSARNPRPLSAYSGFGSWIDIYNHWVWAHPWRTVKRMDKRKVETIYLQTATHGSSNPIVHPRATKDFLAAAHRRGMEVVGWYVPSFTRPRRDLRMARTGLNFGRRAGGFDSFALDIETTNVANIRQRNHRLIWLSKKLRRAAGPDYPLGAVIPDSHSLYWPRFPYRRLRKFYDVMVPMGYFTFRARGFRHVQRYTQKNVHTIRKEAGRDTPIHVIGGIADEVGVPAARGFARAVKKTKILGGSLYDYPITTDKTWRELATRLPKKRSDL
jgi:hypothetical protein